MNTNFLLKFQTKEDTKEIVDATEELLWQLAEDRMSEGENFLYKSQNLGRKLCCSVLSFSHRRHGGLFFTKNPCIQIDDNDSHVIEVLLDLI